MPLLTFMGHWPTSVRIPGTDSYVSVPLAGASRDSETSAHEHAQHCHGDSAECSDAPMAAGAGLALANEGIVVGLSGGLLLVALALAWRPARWATVSPGAEPPEGRALKQWPALA
jgi:hypothetical protein